MPQSMPPSPGLVDKINSVCVDALDKGIQDGMAAKGDEIVKDLMGEGMASKRPVWIHAVGFHPENRFGAGLEPVDAWNLLKNHAPRGWSWNAVEGQARAAEIPIDAAGERIRRRNREVAEASAGLLPPVREEDLLVSAFTKTHTSATLRIIDREGKPPAKDDPFWNGLLKENGCLSREKFLERYPSYVDPLKKGIEWVVIKSEVFNACPRLPAFLQEAGNLDHNVTSKETTLQVCFEANRKICKGTTPDQTARELEKFRPDLKGKCVHLCAFSAMWAGGPDAPFLKQADAFKSTLSARRDIDPQQLGFLATFKISSCSEWVLACVKALLAAPPQYIRGERSVIFDYSDVPRMSSTTGLKD